MLNVGTLYLLPTCKYLCFPREDPREDPRVILSTTRGCLPHSPGLHSPPQPWPVSPPPPVMQAGEPVS